MYESFKLVPSWDAGWGAWAWDAAAFGAACGGIFDVSDRRTFSRNDQAGKLEQEVEV